MVINERGGYQFLPGFKFLSFASVALPGFVIERAIFRKPRPVESGFEEIKSYLASLGRPAQALCGMEFCQHSPSQWLPADFAVFNNAHIQRLSDADMLVEGQVPVARTNVVLNSDQSKEDGGIRAFSYTVPAVSPTSTRDFVLAAIPELRIDSGTVVAEGDESAAGLRKKMDFILDTATQRMNDLGLSWDDATGVQLYCEADIKSFFKETVLKATKQGGWRGVQWHHALPPIGPCIIELDARSVRADITLD